MWLEGERHDSPIPGDGGLTFIPLDPELRHLPGQHDQSTHAGGGRAVAPGAGVDPAEFDRWKASVEAAAADESGGGSGKAAEWQRAPEAAYDQWLSFGGCTQIRYAADLMLGQPHASGVDSAEQDMTYSGFNEALRQVILHGQPTDRPAVEATARHARELLDAVADAPVIDLELHRGVQCYRNDPASEQLLGARPGDTFDVGLFSTTPDPDTANRFAEATGFGIARSSAGSYDTLVPVVIRFPDGVRGVASRPELDLDGWPEDPATGRPAEPTVPFEVVTGGRFRVVDVEVTNPVVGARTITVEQLGVWDPDTAELRSARYQSGGPGWFRLFDGVQGQPRVADGRSVVRLLAELRHPGHPDQKVHAGGRRVVEAELADVAQAEGGFSYDTMRDRLIRHGIAVALSGHSGRMAMSRFRQPGEAQRFVADTLTAWRAAGITTRRVGGWHDTEHDEMVLDPIDIVHGRAAGVELGRARGEQAVFDLDRGEVIDTGGTGGRDDEAVLRGVAWPHGERRGSRTAEGSCGDDRRGDRGGCGCGRCVAARGDERRVLRLVAELRHLPGQHDQSTHGRKGTGGTSGDPNDPTVPVLEGENARTSGIVHPRLVDADGNPVPLSAEAIASVDHVVMAEGGQEPLKSDAVATIANFDEQVDATIEGIIGAENVAGHGRQAFDKNVDMILESALARYADPDDPVTADSDLFYRPWNEATKSFADSTLAEGHTPIPHDRVAAAAAALSPGTKAQTNLRYAAELTELVSRNPRIEDMGFSREQVADGLLERAQYAIRGVSSKGAPKEPGADDIATARALQWAADEVRAGRMTNLNDLPAIAAFHVATASRAVQGPSVDPDGKHPPTGTTPFDSATGMGTWGPPGKNGFAASKGYGAFERAITILRGYEVDTPTLLAGGMVPAKGVETPAAGGARRWANQYGEGVVGQRTAVTPDSALDDIKLRSFYNNIMDPDGRWSGADVTVDFHMENAAMLALGANSDGKGLPKNAKGEGTGLSITSINSNPRVAGAEIGVRAHIADSVRRAVPKLAKALGVPESEVPASRVQEILWAEWKRLTTPPTKTGRTPYYGFEPGPPPTVRPKGGQPVALVDYRNPKKPKKGKKAEEAEE